MSFPNVTNVILDDTTTSTSLTPPLNFAEQLIKQSSDVVTKALASKQKDLEIERQKWIKQVKTWLTEASNKGRRELSINIPKKDFAIPYKDYKQYIGKTIVRDIFR